MGQNNNSNLTDKKWASLNTADFSESRIDGHLSKESKLLSKQLTSKYNNINNSDNINNIFSKYKSQQILNNFNTTTSIDSSIQQSETSPFISSEMYNYLLNKNHVTDNYQKGGDVQGSNEHAGATEDEDEDEDEDDDDGTAIDTPSDEVAKVVKDDDVDTPGDNVVKVEKVVKDDDVVKVEKVAQRGGGDNDDNLDDSELDDDSDTSSTHSETMTKCKNCKNDLSISKNTTKQVKPPKKQAKQAKQAKQTKAKQANQTKPKQPANEIKYNSKYSVNNSDNLSYISSSGESSANNSDKLSGRSSANNSDKLSGGSSANNSDNLSESSISNNNNYLPPSSVNTSDINMISESS